MFLITLLCLVFSEVGGRKLTVGTRLAKELVEFSGDLSLEGLHFWKIAFSAMTHPATTFISSSQAQGAEASEASKQQPESDPSSASDKKVILLPCKNPPSRERVQLWLEARKQYEILQKVRRDTGLLKKGRVGVDVDEHPDRTEQVATSSVPAVKVELCERLSSIRTQRRKKRNMSLIISPVKNTGSQCKSTEVSPVSDEGAVDIEQAEGEKEDDADDDKTSSPESPELPPWQQSCQASPSEPGRLNQDRQSENSPEPLSPGLPYSLERLGENVSPTLPHVSNREEGRTVPHFLHSTPFSRKRRGSREDLEPVCSTPISEGKKTAVSSSLSITGQCVVISVTTVVSLSTFLHCCLSHLCSSCFNSSADDPVSQRLQQRQRSQAEPLRRVLLTTQMKVRPQVCFFRSLITSVITVFNVGRK